MAGIGSINFGAKFSPERFKTIANATCAEIADAINKGYSKVSFEPPRPINGNTLRFLNNGLFDKSGHIKPGKLDSFDHTNSDLGINSQSRLYEYSEAVSGKIQQLKEYNEGFVPRIFDILG